MKRLSSIVLMASYHTDYATTPSCLAYCMPCLLLAQQFACYRAAALIGARHLPSCARDATPRVCEYNKDKLSHLQA